MEVEVQALRSKPSLSDRAQIVRDRFKTLTPEEKASIFQLTPKQIESGYSSDHVVGFCQWEQKWEQWQQSQW
ncbi:hypothetical protein LZD49_32235 [Dyadobacter sp. CY261]|uniref:hypothetical protein n=1 Tax=Dyadobacter sp. CY261 TaxID=2907203 RepID=UPI001F3A9CBF|nr:hypothetical protein [Dyadobacter sp. CY261]MCF0075196.1 hypothetical protein [Dyadobacter sp. CY261]